MIQEKISPYAYDLKNDLMLKNEKLFRWFSFEQKSISLVHIINGNVHLAWIDVGGVRGYRGVLRVSRKFRGVSRFEGGFEGI